MASLTCGHVRRLFGVGLSSFVALLSLSGLLLPEQVSAQDARQTAAENQLLRARIDRLESLVERLQPPASSTDAAAGASPIPTVADTQQALPVANWSLSALDSAGAPAFPTVKLTGFFQADVGWISQDTANRMVPGIGNVRDGADFRRARLAATGNVAENVAYMLEMDFAFPGHPTFMDVWGEVSDLDLVQNLRVGQYRNPFGLDGLTSVKELTFLERGLPFAFLPFRQIGVMAHGVSEEEDATWAISGFRHPTDQFGANIGDTGGYGMASRLTKLVVDESDGLVVHLGGAYSVIDPSNNTVQYRNQPEFFVGDAPTGATPFFVDTGVIAANIVNLFGAEFAATSGPWHAQGEVIYAVVDRSAASAVSFSGVSVQSGYILTGEHRPYNRKAAVLGRIVPIEDFRNGGCGAWEVAARWSYLDLNDGGITGGQLNDLTAGLNWYLNRYAKLQLNYVHAFLKTPGLGRSDADALAMRAQIDF